MEGERPCEPLDAIPKSLRTALSLPMSLGVTFGLRPALPCNGLRCPSLLRYFRSFFTKSTDTPNCSAVSARVSLPVS